MTIYLYLILGWIIFILIAEFLEKKTGKTIYELADWKYAGFDLSDYVDREILDFILTLSFMLTWPLWLFISTIIYIIGAFDE